MSNHSVNIEKLGKENFDTWKLQMEAILVKNDFWSYVNGTNVRPAVPEGADAAAIQTAANWDKADQKAKADIILSMCPSELCHIKHCATSNEVWRKLEEVYHSRGPARKATLLKQLLFTKMRDNESMMDHLNNFFGTVDKLTEMEILVAEDLLAILLLYSIPDSYENFRCAIEARDELPAPEALKIKLLEEYSARKEKIIQREQHSQGAFQAKTFENKNKFHQFKSNSQNRDSEQKFVNSKNRNGSSFQRKSYKCNYCNKPGHKASECWTKNKNKQSSSNVEEAFVAISIMDPETVEEKKLVIKECANQENLVNCATVEEEASIAIAMNAQISSNKNWCVDSGATSHMCNDRSKFLSFSPVNNQKVRLAVDATTEIIGKGTVLLTVSDECNSKNIKLNDTLCVPDLKTNLLSISKTTANGYYVNFKNSHAMILNQKGEVVVKAERKGDLYFINDFTESTAAASSNSGEMLEWHNRYGHLNEKDLKKLCVKGMIKGMSIDDSEKLPFCETCILGKQSAKPFPQISLTRSNKPLELIHSDVCGPMRTKSIGGSTFFATFIDDKSRYVEVFFLKAKSDVKKSFLNFKALAENQTECKIKTLRTDNGLEYCGTEFTEEIERAGIRRERTVAHTPEQNGVAERMNRTLIEMARCLLIKSELPLHFWAECISTAAYLRNRCPSRSLDNVTPFEARFGVKPDVSNLKTFGCKAYALNKDPSKNKLGPKSKICVFIGYSDESKAYRLWDPASKRIIKSRDVVFDEDSRGLPDLVKKEDFLEFEMLFPQSEINPVEAGAVDAEEDEQSHENQIPVENHVPDEDPTQAENQNQEIQSQNAIPCGNQIPDENHSQAESHDQSENQNKNYIQDRNQIEAESDQDYLDASSSRQLLETPVYSTKRGPGRPTFEKTGKRGRRRKLFNMVPISEESENNSIHKANLIDDEITNPTVNEAIAGPYAKEWKDAMKSEFDALQENKAWILVDRPVNKNVIDCRWVLRTKFNADGSVERRKARLVARGFSQQPGVDYQETFSPVARLSSIRIVVALAAEWKLTLYQLDVVMAYINGNLDEEIFMEQADGFIKPGEEEKVYFLKKSLYGLKQSGRQWFTKLDKKLQELGFKSLNGDKCIYIIKSRDFIMILVVYVDDIIVATNQENKYIELKEELVKEFKVSDLGTLHYCLGIEFEQDPSTKSVKMYQRKYITKILQDFGMDESKPMKTPLDGNSKLSKQDAPRTNEEITEMKDVPYQSLIGALMYLAVSTRPDIAYTISVLSQYNVNPGKMHWAAGKRVLRYLRNTTNHGLIFRKTQEKLIGFVDADWAGDVDTRVSHTGYVFKLADAAVTWEARKQKTIALSSTEAEYMALTEAAKETVYLRNLLKEIGFLEKDAEPTIVYCDNQGAQKLMRNPIYHSRSKHIDIKHHYVREIYQRGEIDVKYLATSNMIADVLTKGLFGPSHKKCIEGFGLSSVN